MSRARLRPQRGTKSCRTQGESVRPYVSAIQIIQMIGIVGRARRFLDNPQLILLCNTMVLPHLQYCLINWGNFKDDRKLKYRDRILRLQNCFLRIIYSGSRLSHADPLFARMGTLKIDDLFKQSVTCFSFKLTKNMLPIRM